MTDAAHASGEDRLTPAARPVSVRALYAGIACISASLMLTEILVLRQWKVAFGVQASHVVVPGVMLGIALGSSLAFLLVRLMPRRTAGAFLLLAYLYAASAPWQFIEMGNNAGWRDSARVGRALSTTGSAAAAQWRSGVASFVGFASAGATVTLAFFFAPALTSTLYATSLFGSAAALFALTPLLDAAGTPGAIACMAGLALLAVALLTLAVCRRWWLRGATCLVVTAALAWVGLALPQRVVVSVYGSLALFSGSNAIAQVEIAPTRGSDRHYPASRGRASIPMWNIAVDDRTSTRALAYETLQDCAFLRKDLGFLSFCARPARRAVVIGAGGGVDVIQALLAGIPQVTAVEINRLMVEGVRWIPSPIYSDPRVVVEVEEGRLFLATHPNERWDLIVLPHVKTFGSGSGLMTNVKDRMLTREGLQLCLRRLSPEGVLVIRDTPKTYDWHLDTLVAAVGENADQGTLLRADGERDSFVVYSPTRFSDAEVERYGRAAGELASVARVSPSELAAALAGTNMTTDDTASAYHSFVFDDDPDKASTVRSSPWVPPFLEPFLAACIALVFLPAVFAWPPRGQRVATALLVVAYVALGAGFALFEMALMDLLVPLIGHPLQSVTLAIGALLTASGLGSIVLARPGAAHPCSRAAMYAIVGSLLLIVAHQGLRIITPDFTGPVAARIAVAAVAIAIPGFLLGAPFPLGLQSGSRMGPTVLPWLWTVNGCGAFVAGVSSRPLIATWGLSTTSALACSLYLVAACALACVPVFEPRTGAARGAEGDARPRSS